MGTAPRVGKGPPAPCIQASPLLGLDFCRDKTKGHGIERRQSLASTQEEMTAICREVEEQEGPGAARVPR